MLACSYSARCSGCDWLLVSAGEQRRRKIENLSATAGAVIPAGVEIGFTAIAEGGLRDRVDLMLDRRGSGKQRLGLFDRFKTGIVDLEGCPQLSPELEAWLADFRRLSFPIERGSVRLRVGPAGQRGVWLDFANADVKMLLDEDRLLRELLGRAAVEIGQRRKRLVLKEGRLKLVDPVLEPWFETYLGEKPAPLYCAIGSFTQPGFRANRALVNEAMKPVLASGARRVIEFGSGIGNFTLPLAHTADRVDAYEVDGLALQGLKMAAAQQAELGVERLKIHEGNFQGEKSGGVGFAEADLVFVDPPRSGLMKFLDPLVHLARRPRDFVYVSCFAESFALDAARLASFGYRLRTIAIVDQFPQSRHYEIVASFRRH